MDSKETIIRLLSNYCSNKTKEGNMTETLKAILSFRPLQHLKILG